MLPAARRVRRREEFTAATRHGRRVGARGLVLHVTSAPTPGPARAGVIVGRANGGSVARNQLRRRLRHLLAARLDRLPDATVLVVRATPPAAQCSGSQLAATLDALLDRAFGVARTPAVAAS